MCVCVLVCADHSVQTLAASHELAVSRPRSSSGQLWLAWGTAGTEHTCGQPLRHMRNCHKFCPSLNHKVEDVRAVFENQNVWCSTVGPFSIFRHEASDEATHHFFSSLFLFLQHFPSKVVEFIIITQKAATQQT